ncbi:MAG: ankyrin repeat domain-containing protein [Armatimonadota bacterium]
MNAPEKYVPVDPRLPDFEREAAGLLAEVVGGNPDSVADAERWLARHTTPARFGLDDARAATAAAYGYPNWDRLVDACAVCAAVRADDPERLAHLIAARPELLRENARGTARCNWGPPLSYAANLGCDRALEWLLDHGAPDIDHAFDRACLQGRIPTARLLHARGARPRPGAVMGPAETQDAAGMEYLLSIGAEIADAEGDPWAPVGLLLETYCRDAEGRGRCLDLFAKRGVVLPDSPVMDFLRRRWDALDARLDADPGLAGRTFAHAEIWPPQLGCHADPVFALHGTPLAGTTLLHLAVDFDELEFLARWLRRGLDPDPRAAIDAEGFGGHTPLFGTVVSQACATRVRRDGAGAELLLEHGARPNVRASLRKRLLFHDDETEHVYRNVTPVGWGNSFHGRNWVDAAALAKIVAAGGVD